MWKTIDDWVRQPVPPVPTDGKLTRRTQPDAANGQAYFRLNANRTVKIGALFSFTGESRARGGIFEEALNIALEAVNLEELSSGSGLRFHSEVRDTKFDPALALSQLQDLASDGVRIVIGPQSSAEVALLKPFADANDILLVSPTSTASSLSIADDNVLRFCPNDTYEAQAMVALLQADGIEAIIPVWRDDAGNQGLRDSIVFQFPMRGGTVHAGVKYEPTKPILRASSPNWLLRSPRRRRVIRERSPRRVTADRMESLKYQRIGGLLGS